MSDSVNNEKKYLLVNAYDDLVKSTAREWIDKSDMCKCEKCYLDVCAMVFNRRYTHFVTTREGELLAKVPQMTHNNQMELTATVLDAIRKVKDFPMH